MTSWRPESGAIILMVVSGRPVCHRTRTLVCKFWNVTSFSSENARCCNSPSLERLPDDDFVGGPYKLSRFPRYDSRIIPTAYTDDGGDFTPSRTWNWNIVHFVQWCILLNSWRCQIPGCWNDRSAPQSYAWHSHIRHCKLLLRSNWLVCDRAG